jgi:hypothetical protein
LGKQANIENHTIPSTEGNIYKRNTARQNQNNLMKIDKITSKSPRHNNTKSENKDFFLIDKICSGKSMSQKIKQTIKPSKKWDFKKLPLEDPFKRFNLEKQSKIKSIEN